MDPVRPLPRPGVERRLEDGQQRSHDEGRTQPVRGRRDLGSRIGEEVQKFGGDVELRELGQCRKRIQHCEAKKASRKAGKYLKGRGERRRCTCTRVGRRVPPGQRTRGGLSDTATEEKRWRSLLPARKRRRLCSALWCRGNRRDSGFAEGLMVWLREIGLEVVGIIVKSDTEPALTSLTESWSNLRAMKGGSRMIVESSPVGSSQSNGTVERAIQSVQGMVRTLRSSLEEKCEKMLEAVQRWIAEHAGFLLTRFEIGRDGNRPRCKA